MKRVPLLVATLLLLAGCNGIKITKTMLKMMVSAYSKPSSEIFYADSCENRGGIPYLENGDPAQVLDVYYADNSVRKDAVLIDIHGGFYIAGKRENNRRFASFFLKEGYDVVLLEYRLNDGKRDVYDQLSDCAAGLDYLTTHSEELKLNKDRMFLTGDSAGGHLALYMAEGTRNWTLPVRPREFKTAGVLLNCPAYDFATFGESDSFARSALEWFLGPRFEDKEWMKSMSPRTHIESYFGPLFVSTCTNDFIRSQSLILKADCDSLGHWGPPSPDSSVPKAPFEFVDIASDDKQVDHVHNVTRPDLPESREVNRKMVAFMGGCLKETP